MMTTLPRPFQYSGQYQGKFARPAFKLMSSATQPLHENLYGAVRKYGASFQDMKVENIATGNVTVTYEIPSLSITVRVRLDMLDINCTNLFAISEEQAYQLITDFWNAVNEADDSIVLIQHVVTTSAGFNLTREIQSKVFEPIINFPKDHRPDVGILQKIDAFTNPLPY